MNAGDTFVLFSHGGSIEPTFIRLMLLANGTPLSDQTAEMIDIEMLGRFSGMLNTGEAYQYELVIDPKIGIVDADKFDHIRLPGYPIQ